MYIYTTSLSFIHIFIYNIQHTLVLMGTLQLLPHLAYCICCGSEHRVHFIFSKLYFHILWISPRSRTGSYDNSNNILRNCHVVFHSGCTNLLSHEQYMRFFLSYIFSNTFLFLFDCTSQCAELPWPEIKPALLAVEAKSLKHLFFC